MCKPIHPCLPMPSARTRSLTKVAVVFAVVSLGAATDAQAKPFMEYIKPMPPVEPLSDATWGDPGVLPRDLANGIESAKGKAVPPEWHYWDGQIIRAQDGKFHLFHSTWLGSNGFNPGWTGSDAYHSVSEKGVLGPYKRKDYVYTNGGSHKGHNVTALELKDGSYAVVVGEVVPLAIYKATSLDGPFTACSPQINSQIGGSNVSIFQRSDGKFQAVERHGSIAVSDTLCGTYVKQTPKCKYTPYAAGSIYPKRTSTPNVPNAKYEWEEDPHIWESGGIIHVIYSGSGDRVGWHVYSPDGINDWTDNGYAWSPREYAKIFCYEGSTTCNQWFKMERPSVVLQDGHPTHITWAVADVDKDFAIPGGSNHGSKIIVIPFDGVAFDNDFGVGNKDGGAPVDTATDRPSGTGGSAGSGGAVGGSDGSASDGATSSGGIIGSGGSAGIAATGGGTAGSVNTGGTSVGGTLAKTGGSTGGSASVGSGGISGSGGHAGANSSSGGTSPTPVNQTSSGCSCTLQGRASAGGGGALPLLGFVLIPVLRRRRSGRAK